MTKLPIVLMVAGAVALVTTDSTYLPMGLWIAAVIAIIVWCFRERIY